MWWLLRRARLSSAAAFFNSGHNNKIAATKADARPQRKDYNQLSSAEKNENDDSGDTMGKVCKCYDSNPLDTGREQNAACLQCADLANNNRAQLHRDDLSDTDYDEALTCNVCDRSFLCRRQLNDHQQKKRHFGCSACDSLFPSLMALEHHKEEFEHWSMADYDSDSDMSDDSLTSLNSLPGEDCKRLL